MNVITIEGKALGQLAELISSRTIYRLRVAEDGDFIKIKVNEEMWSPPISKEG